MNTGTRRGVITPGCVYTVTELRQQLNLGDKSWKQLKDAGLVTIKIGRHLVLSDDVILACIKIRDSYPRPKPEET